VFLKKLRSAFCGAAYVSTHVRSLSRGAVGNWALVRSPAPSGCLNFLWKKYRRANYQYHPYFPLLPPRLNTGENVHVQEFSNPGIFPKRKRHQRRRHESRPRFLFHSVPSPGGILSKVVVNSTVRCFSSSFQAKKIDFSPSPVPPFRHFCSSHITQYSLLFPQAGSSQNKNTTGSFVP
jgi:hypothetical protein